MQTAATSLKTRIEAALADRIPSALTPAAKLVRETTPTGIAAVDELVRGGVPVGALTEMVGAECAGRTSLALSIVAQVTRTDRVCAWVDACDALSPESAASCGVELARLLWVRCGVSQGVQRESSTQPSFALPPECMMPPKLVKGLHGGGHGGHPRNEIKGMSESMRTLLQTSGTSPRCAEPQRHIRPLNEAFPLNSASPTRIPASRQTQHAAVRIDQALRVTDLLLQAGGFSVLVLDLGGLAAEHVLRIPMATWFRYRAAAERTRTSIVIVTQYAVTKSSAELVMQLQSKQRMDKDTTVMTGMTREIEVARHRFIETPGKIVPLRKPPQRATSAKWTSSTSWVSAQ